VGGDVQMFWMPGCVILFGVLAALNGLWIIRSGAHSLTLRPALLLVFFYCLLVPGCLFRRMVVTIRVA